MKLLHNEPKPDHDEHGDEYRKMKLLHNVNEPKPELNTKS
jgi:hypothetical protein